MAPVPVHVLNFQRDFQCRHSGECCAFGWHIPVEPQTGAVLVQAMRDGRFRVPGCRPEDGTDAWLDCGAPPEGAIGVLRMRGHRTCICFEPDPGRLCAIQRQLGHDALPSACQQFPRATLVDDRGAHVALSHYCPTVAEMLIGDADVAADIVPLGPDHPERRPPEGFDARAALPPFLRPGVAFNLASFDAWERAIVRALGDPAVGADARLAAVAAAAEDLRSWTPARGPMAGEVGRLTIAVGRGARAAGAGEPSRESDSAAVARLFDMVAASVPEGLPRPTRPPGLEDADQRYVASAWARLSPPVGRFLAAKAFASPVAWQGEGVRTQVMAIGAARAVLRVEVARLAGVTRNPADETTVVAAARAADALLAHLSDRQSLVRAWAFVERLPRAAFLAGLGVGDLT